MKRLLLLILTLTLQQNIFAQCNVGSYTVSGNDTITSSCIITGDLTIQNGASLIVDYTGATADTFVVRGNILLQGNAELRIHSATGSTNDQFIVSNNFSGHRTITTKDSSKLMLEHIEFRTQEGNLSNAASIYMNYYAEDSSIFYIDKSWLDHSTAWLLCDIKNNSTLVGHEPNGVPTEMYLQDAAQVSVHGANTNVGIWLNFDGITDTLNLHPNPTQAFSWTVGRGYGGLNTLWHLELDSVKVAPGVQIFPSTQLMINGAGIPAAKELTVALLFANGTDTLENLTVGMQNTTITNGSNGYVTFNNVELGPIAWQIYALMNENLFIKNSIINEIGIFGPSQVTVDSTLLQLAVLASVGIGGSTMIINNSEIWNQSITATNNSSITLNDCNVHGSHFGTTDGLSTITVNGGCFFENPSGCTQNTMINWTTGQPYCNPFIPAGSPQNLTPATVSFIGVDTNCVTGLNEIGNNEKIEIFPNPTSSFVQVNIPNPNQNYDIRIYSTLGELLINTKNKNLIDLGNFKNGIYILILSQGNNIWTNKIVKK